MLSLVKSRRAFSGRELKAIRQQHGMFGDFLGSVEIFFKSVGDMSVRASAALVNPSPAKAPPQGISRVGGGFGLGEVADGVVILGIAEATQRDIAGITGTSPVPRRPENFVSRR